MSSFFYCSQERSILGVLPLPGEQDRLEKSLQNKAGGKKIESILKNHPDILIVDDSAIIRKGLSRQLEQCGARVTQAEDGQQGLKAALSTPFDLIISDVEMPNLDGFGLCELLKGNPKTKGIPVIILSSLYTDDDIDRGFKVGAAAYISKSDAQSQLSRTIEKVLEKSRFHHTRTILVVEDSPTIRSLVKKGLEEAGFQVITAENGKEAMKILQRDRPDLILSDIEMPEMNGIDLCR
jgi:CheY-like chemotaxis protein